MSVSLQSSLRISKPTLFLCAFLGMAQFIYGFRAALVGENLFPWDALHAIGIYWLLSLWFINDSRSSGIRWVDDYMDMGMFLYIAWIFILPYYLFKSRGWRALYLVLLLGIYFGAYLAGAVTHFLLSLPAGR